MKIHVLATDKPSRLVKSIYNEFMLEWMIPGKESNTLISKSLKELLKVVEEKQINKHVIKGWNGKEWDILVNKL